MKPLSTDQEPAGRTQCALSAVGCRLSAASARALTAISYLLTAGAASAASALSAVDCQLRATEQSEGAKQ